MTGWQLYASGLRIRFVPQREPRRSMSKKLRPVQHSNTASEQNELPFRAIVFHPRNLEPCCSMRNMAPSPGSSIRPRPQVLGPVRGDHVIFAADGYAAIGAASKSAMISLPIHRTRNILQTLNDCQMQTIFLRSTLRTCTLSHRVFRQTSVHALPPRGCLTGNTATQLVDEGHHCRHV